MDSRRIPVWFSHALQTALTAAIPDCEPWKAGTAKNVLAAAHAQMSVGNRKLPLRWRRYQGRLRVELSRTMGDPWRINYAFGIVPDSAKG
jgi:hypothetical protein